MLEKKSVIDKIEILEDGTLQIRKKDTILENGRELSFSYWRTTILPGDSLDKQIEDIKNDSRIISILPIIHTKKVIKEFNDKKKDFPRDKKE